MEIETTPPAESEAAAPPAPVPAAPAEPAPPKPDDRKADIRAAVQRLNQPTPDAPPIGETAEAKALRLRDERGRFAEGKAVVPAATAKLVVAQPKPVEAASPEPALRPPADWKPAAREKWGGLPREIQEETLRTHAEARKTLSEASQARQFATQVQQTLTPYQQILGANPIQGMDGILRTAHALATAPPQHKAQIIANLMRGYNVPIEHFVAAYDGGPQQQAPQAPPIDPQAIVAQVRQQMQQEHAQTQASAAIQAFAADPKNEFFNDVRPAVLGLLQGGVASSLEDAYKKACSLDPSIAAALRQREDSKAATARLATTQAARAASSSLRSSPAGPVRPEVPRAGDDRLSDFKRVAARLGNK